MTLKWQHQLTDLVNSVAISSDGALVVAGTYYFPYEGTPPERPTTEGTFGTFAFDATGTPLWSQPITGNEGVYAVAISGDGKVVASGGLRQGGSHQAPPPKPTVGLVQAFTAGGTVLLDGSANSRVNSVSLSHAGSVLAGVTLDGQLFVHAGTPFPATPLLPVTHGSRLDMVVVHPSGTWLVACGKKGFVHLVTLGGTGTFQRFTWQEPNQRRLLACAIAANDEHFIVGGKNELYLFSKTSMTAPSPGFLHHVPTPSGFTSEDVRWVAISADGTLVSVVQNIGDDLAGLLLTYRRAGGQLQLERWRALDFNPNSTSIDAAGTLVTAADGHPVGPPGTFYVFRASDGERLLEHKTSDMNWPMVVSADGTAAAAGSDNGKVYYFGP
jgi:WD40 repeat protein